MPAEKKGPEESHTDALPQEPQTLTEVLGTGLAATYEDFINNGERAKTYSSEEFADLSQKLQSRLKNDE